MTRSFQAVLFDVENVIAHHDTAELERRLALLAPGLDAERLQQVRDRPDLYVLWDTYSVGGMSSDAYWSAILVGLGLPRTEAGVDALRGAYRAGAWVHRDAAVLGIVDRLRAAGYRLGILSNSAPEHEAHAGPIVSHFDVALFSHRLGQRKPNAPAYLAAAEALGVAPAAVLFIDDKARNARAAEAVGMSAVVFTDAARLAVDLAQLGLLPADAGAPA